MRSDDVVCGSDKNISLKEAGLWNMTETWVTAYRKIGIGKTDYRRRWRLFIHTRSWYNCSGKSKRIVSHSHSRTVFILFRFYPVVKWGRRCRTFWPKSNIPVCVVYVCTVQCTVYMYVWKSGFQIVCRKKQRRIRYILIVAVTRCCCWTALNITIAMQYRHVKHTA